MTFYEVFHRDYKRFSEVHGRGLLPVLYYPMLTAVLMYRLSVCCNNFWLLRPFAYLLVRLNDFFHGIWIGPNVKSGPGLFLGHARGLVVNPSTVLGADVSIMQRVTLGGPNIRIGDNVQINASATIIAPKCGKGLRIGNDVVIGACAVVTKDIPARAVVIGNPARILKYC